MDTAASDGDNRAFLSSLEILLTARFSRRSFVISAAVAGPSLFAAGCATQGEAFTAMPKAPADKAVVYVYRTGRLDGGALTPSVTFAHTVKVALTRSGYYAYVAEPGALHVRITDIGTRVISLDVKAGQTYYLRGGLIFMAGGYPFLDVVTADEALPELKDCKLISRVETIAPGASEPAPTPAPASAPQS